MGSKKKPDVGKVGFEKAIFCGVAAVIGSPEKKVYLNCFYFILNDQAF